MLEVTSFPSWDSRYALLKKVQGIVAKVTGKRVRLYS